MEIGQKASRERIMPTPSTEVKAITLFLAETAMTLSMVKMVTIPFPAVEEQILLLAVKEMTL